MQKIPFPSYAHGADLYWPDGTPRALFVYFHGGGLTGGDKKDADPAAAYLTEKGVAMISANYRMYPAAAYPDFLRDAAEAVACAQAFAQKEWGDMPLFVGGSSAGGYISMMLCFDRRHLTEAGVAPSAISGYFHDAGQPTAHFNVLKFAGVDPRRVIVDETAPLYYIGLEPTYPPMRFIVSDNDMKGRYEQTMLLLSALSHFEYQGFDHRVMQGKHCAYCKQQDENGESIFGQMIYDFIKDHID